MFKRVALLSLCLPVALSLLACTDEEVATNTAVIGDLVIGAAIVAAAVAAPSGDIHRDIHNQPHPDPRDRRFSTQINLSLPGQTQAPDAAAALSFKYGLSSAGSAKIVSALSEAKQGSLSGISALGLSQDDLSSIANGRMPSAAAIELLSKQLNSSEAATNSFVNDVVMHVQSQQVRM